MKQENNRTQPAGNGMTIAEVESRIAAFERTCRQARLRVTPQRTAIYRELILTDQHPSAEAVCRAVRRYYPAISLDTVNRTLLTLVKMGVAFVVEGSGEAKRFDAGDASHQHFKCLNCRRILDFRHDEFMNVPVPPQLEGFQIIRKTVYFEGLCDKCKS